MRIRQPACWPWKLGVLELPARTLEASQRSQNHRETLTRGRLKHTNPAERPGIANAILHAHAPCANASPPAPAYDYRFEVLGLLSFPLTHPGCNTLQTSPPDGKGAW